MPSACGHFVPVPDRLPDENPQKFGLDSISVRNDVMKALQAFWEPEEFHHGRPFVPATCADLLPCWCGDARNRTELHGTHCAEPARSR